MRHRPNESAHTQVQTGIRLLSSCSSRTEQKKSAATKVYDFRSVVAHNMKHELVEICYCAIPKEPVDIERSMLHVIGSSEGKRDLSRLSSQLMCRTCRRWCAVPLHRTKHLKGRAGRAQTGGHDDLTFMTSAPQHHGAFWHFPPRRARSLKARANHATHPTPRARESIGYVSVVITT